MHSMELLQAILAGKFEVGAAVSEGAQALLRRLLVVRPGLRLGCGANGSRDVRWQC